jgi:hypothetical protein
MDLQKKYADKIAKLLAKAESTTPEEAELLTSKAQELMSKWAIDEAMVEAARGFDQERNAIVHEEFVIVGIFRFPQAELLSYVLHANDLMYVLLQDNTPREIDGKLFKETRIRRATGFKSDMDRARFMFTSLQLQAMTAKDAWWRENKEWAQHERKGGHYEQRQFLFSFAEAAGYRLYMAKLKAQQETEKDLGQDIGAESSSVAIALRDKNALVDKAYHDRYPHLKTSRAREFAGGSGAAASAGYAAGQKADLGQGGSIKGTGKRGALKK